MQIVPNPRRLASLIYRKRIRLFDSLNKNTLYNHVLKTVFAGAPEFPDRFSLYAHINREILANEPIQYLEFGVWRGVSLQKWCELNSAPESRFYGFDTFEGLPEDWNKNHPRGSFDVAGKMPAPRDPRVNFTKGLFQETLADFLKGFSGIGRMVVHIDCDLYSSALFCLATLHPLLKPGSIIIFDEFRELDDEFSAFWDYSRAFYRKWRGLGFALFYTHVALLVES
ncbi:MAG TPA: class I SAM-dependent methyltransferase [Candidatus Acidoferrum sp.]|nr:class I SAM-dependent methyltransferase [Candidatus Acidoferrum sp.]